MLTELRISQFALIDHLHLVFSEGFHVLTGETGAGKSLLVDALFLLLGGRSSGDFIRTDAEEAILEAVFSLPPNNPIISRLRDLEFLSEGETDILIRRVLSRTGRNRLYVNGNLGSVQVLQELAKGLVDVHSQHDQQSLFSPTAQLEVLDGFAKIDSEKDQYLQHYQSWQQAERSQEEMELQSRVQREREDILRFHIEELEKAELHIGEEEALIKEHHRLQHVERLQELTCAAYHALYAQDHSLLERLKFLRSQVEELATIDLSLDAWPGLCENAEISLRELSNSLRDYRENIEYDPARLTYIDERLSKLQRLQKKFGGTTKSLIDQLASLKEELTQLTRSQEQLNSLEMQIASEWAAVRRFADQLAIKRRKAAKWLEKKIVDELNELGMQQVKFQIEILPLGPQETVNATGGDRVEFLLSANPGEPPQPLNRIASGGELSRIMLAMKTVLAESDRIPVLIFDEVDSGIGGTVATRIGERLRNLANFHQVFCITHLPQIAAYAHRHFSIEKDVINKRTMTHVKPLNNSERAEELARMLGGATITPSVRRTASEMIARAGKKPFAPK